MEQEMVLCKYLLVLETMIFTFTITLCLSRVE